MSHLGHWRLGGLILPIMFGALLDRTGFHSSAFMPMFGVVGVSLVWVYGTEVRATGLMDSKAGAFRLHDWPPQFNQGKP